MQVTQPFGNTSDLILKVWLLRVAGEPRAVPLGAVSGVRCNVPLVRILKLRRTVRQKFSIHVGAVRDQWFSIGIGRDKQHKLMLSSPK